MSLLNKTLDIIKSCESQEQLEIAQRFIKLGAKSIHKKFDPYVDYSISNAGCRVEYLRAKEYYDTCIDYLRKRNGEFNSKSK